MSKIGAGNEVYTVLDEMRHGKIDGRVLIKYRCVTC
jgi:hypothetical protein